MISARAVRSFVILSLGAAGCGGAPSNPVTPNDAGVGDTTAGPTEFGSGDSSVPLGNSPTELESGSDGGILINSFGELPDATWVTTEWTCAQTDGGSSVVCSVPVPTSSPLTWYSVGPNYPSDCTPSDLARLATPILEPTVSCDILPSSFFSLVVDDQGHVTDAYGLNQPDGGNCIVAALSDETFPCLDGDSIRYSYIETMLK